MIKPYYQEPNITIYHGDCRDILPHLEPVDLVLTDPPWADEYIDIYGVIARANLKDNGFVIAYTGNDWLPQIMGMLADAGLSWYRMFSGVQLNSDDRYFAKSLFVKWRPIVVYSKNNSKQYAWCPDAHQTNRDKRYHEWGQGDKYIKKIIHSFSPVEGVVLDPCLGGGTTLRAAKDLGRKAIGIEIEEKYCEIAVRRLKQEVLPLNQ